VTHGFRLFFIFIFFPASGDVWFRISFPTSADVWFSDFLYIFFTQRLVTQGLNTFIFYFLFLAFLVFYFF